MKLVLVCGPWGSGTSAVAGLLAELGAQGVAPYFQTNDPRTPNSFESIAFKALIRRSVSEEQMKLRTDGPSTLASDLVAFREQLTRHAGSSPLPVFLKDCLATLIIEPICAAFDARLVYVIRSLEEIEATRCRRGWPEQFGALGARIVYAAMFDALIRGDFPTLVVRYQHLVRAPSAVAEELVRFAGIEPHVDLGGLSFIRTAPVDAPDRPV